MNKPKLRNLIYHQLKQQILNRELRPGCLLPDEPSFAKHLGISRGTLRSVLECLEKEALVSRTKGKGTIVNRGDRQPFITYIQPAPGIYYENCLDYHGHSRMHHLIIQGIIRAANDFNCRVEILPLSPINDIREIDWGRLFNLDANSRIIMCGTWFSPIFKFLSELGCKTLLIHAGNFFEPQDRPYLKNFTLFSENNCSLTGKLVDCAASENRKRIVLLGSYLDEPEQPRVKGFYNALNRNGLQKDSCSVHSIDTFQADASKLFNLILEIYRGKKIDAMITEGRVINKLQTLNPNIRLLFRQAIPDMAIYAYLTTNWNNYINSGISTCNFPLEQIGYDAVDALSKEPYHVFEKVYEPELMISNIRMDEHTIL